VTDQPAVVVVQDLVQVLLAQIRTRAGPQEIPLEKCFLNIFGAVAFISLFRDRNNMYILRKNTPQHCHVSPKT
jgi:hypothetical protein